MQATFEANMTEGKPLNGSQKNYVRMIRKSFKKYELEIEDLKLYRYDHNNFRDEYEPEEEEKELKEKNLKDEVTKKKRKVKFHIDNQVKAVIKTNYENIKQFVFTSFIPPSTVEIIENIYTFYYPKPLEIGFLWGRYIKEEKHGGGEFYFAPTTLNLMALIKERGNDINTDDLINKLEKLNGDDLLASTIYSVCDLITRIRHSNRIKDEFSSFKRKFDEGFMDYTLMEKLNSQEQLSKTLSQEVITFGEKSIINVANFKSKTDIAIMGFNYKSGCIIQLANYTNRIIRTMIVIKKLVEILNSLTGKAK